MERAAVLLACSLWDCQLSKYPHLLPGAPARVPHRTSVIPWLGILAELWAALTSQSDYPPRLRDHQKCHKKCQLLCGCPNSPSPIHPSIHPSDRPSQVCSLITGQSVRLVLPRFTPQHFIWGKAVSVLTLPSKNRTKLGTSLRPQVSGCGQGPHNSGGSSPLRASCPL